MLILASLCIIVNNSNFALIFRHRSLTVSLATAGMELTDTVELKSDHPARHLHLPSLPTKVFVYATGAGCATVQVRVHILICINYISY